jgi:hypothetical protein
VRSQRDADDHEYFANLCHVEMLMRSSQNSKRPRQELQLGNREFLYDCLAPFILKYGRG